MSDDPELEALATQVGDALARAGWTLATAESCTGGWISQVVTSVPGSSAWFDCGWVTYSNAAKSQLLGVDPRLIVEHGAVSEPVVRAMTAGVLTRTDANIAMAVSGVAGPGGGSPAKPVGMVWLAWQVRGDVSQATSYRFGGNRTEVRRQAVVAGLTGVVERAAKNGER